MKMMTYETRHLLSGRTIQDNIGQTKNVVKGEGIELSWKRGALEPWNFLAALRTEDMLATSL